MTRAELKKQAMARVKVPAGSEDQAQAALDKWLVLYPAAFKFGPAAVMAACRLVQREMRVGG